MAQPTRTIEPVYTNKSRGPISLLLTKSLWSPCVSIASSLSLICVQVTGSVVVVVCESALRAGIRIRFSGT